MAGSSTLGQYLPLLALLLLSTLFAAASLMASRLLAPRNPTIPKLAPYECGIVPAREAPDRFPVRFFLVGMAFIVFDVEIILFYPYAVARGGLGLFGLVIVLIFSFAVFESFLYLIGVGALDWGPVSHSQPVATKAAAGQSVTRGGGLKTVRCVGLEGRWEAVDAASQAPADSDSPTLAPADSDSPAVPSDLDSSDPGDRPPQATRVGVEA